MPVQISISISYIYVCNSVSVSAAVGGGRRIRRSRAMPLIAGRGFQKHWRLLELPMPYSNEWTGRIVGIMIQFPAPLYIHIYLRNLVCKYRHIFRILFTARKTLILGYW